MKRRYPGLLILLLSLISVAYTAKANEDVNFRCGNAEETTTATKTTTDSTTVTTVSEVIIPCAGAICMTTAKTSADATESSAALETTKNMETLFTEATPSRRATTGTNGDVTMKSTTPSTRWTTDANTKTTVTRNSSKTISSTDAAGAKTEVPGVYSSTVETTSSAAVTAETINEAASTPMAAFNYSCDSFNYVVKDVKTGEAPCVLTNMTIQINVYYVSKDNKPRLGILLVPREAQMTGLCHNESAEMILSWREAEHQPKDDENKITFSYARDDSEFFLDAILVDIHLDGKNFPGVQFRRIKGYKPLRLFSASIKNGIFKNNKRTKIDIGNEISVIIYDISLIALTTCTDDTSKKENTVAQASFDVRAIIGGLFGFICLVLIISFLIWRKRKKDVVRTKNLIP